MLLCVALKWAGQLTPTEWDAGPHVSRYAYADGVTMTNNKVTWSDCLELGGNVFEARSPTGLLKR